MTSALKTRFYIFCLSQLAAFVLLSPEAVRAKEAAALPEYVIKQFGKPPAVPTGPLSVEIKAAIDTAFIKSVQQSDWLEEQSDALVKIIDSKDKRLAWIVSDLMRFVPGTKVSHALTYAAFKLLVKDPITSRPRSDVTDLLMAWDIPAPPDYL